MKKLLLGLLTFSFFVTSNSYADDFSLDNLSQSDFDGVAEEFSANFVHTTVSGASSLGRIFGFEVGVVGRMTNSPNTEKLVKEQVNSSEISSIYDAGLMGALSIPFGITAELTLLPEVDFSDLTVDKKTLAVKWTMTDGLLVLPFNLALRAHYSTAQVSYKDVVNNASTAGLNVDATVGIETKSYGAQLLASADFMIVEPYAGIGYVKSDTDINVGASGGTTIFSFTSSQNASSSSSGFHYFLGAELNLLTFHFGAEYSNVYGVDRYTGKVAFGF